MWYPLKNSVYALAIAAMALMVLLAVGSPVPPAQQQANLSGEEHSRAMLAVEHALPHLFIADVADRARATAALRLAAAAISDELKTQPGAGSGSRLASSRRQAAMPFFSFGSPPDRSRDPSA